MNMCDCRVTSHGKRQLELNVRFPVHAGKLRQQVDVFFFTPFHLGLTQDRYGSRAFFKDLSSYVRMMPAPLSFGALVDPGCDISPLNRIRAILEDTHLSRDLNTEKILYELRMLVNIHHEQIRGVRILLRNMVRDGSPSADIAARLEPLCDEHDAFLQAFRDLRTSFLDPHVPEILRQGMRWADEAISLKAEKECFKVYDMCVNYPELDKFDSRLLSRVSGEQEHRAEQNYTTVLDPSRNTSGELFLYRESILKKWAQGATYMSVATSRASSRIAHVLAGIAAATAMAFAVAVTFLAQQLFLSYSLPWAILIVIAYIFKDRIKEILRSVFIRYLPRLVADDAKVLIDPSSGSRVGSTRSRVYFKSAADVPEAVQRLRNIQGNPFRDILPPENVIHFQSDTSVNCDRLLDVHTRVQSIAEILRLQLDRWIEGMDEPRNAIDYVVDGQRGSMDARRVYHVNAVVRLSENRRYQDARLFKVRLILTRDGLERIEHLESLNK